MHPYIPFPARNDKDGYQSMTPLLERNLPELLGVISRWRGHIVHENTPTGYEQRGFYLGKEVNVTHAAIIRVVVDIQSVS